MAKPQYIVVWDPSGTYWDGSLVDETRARQLETRGVSILPVHPELFRRSGVGGFHKRSWGAGWSLDFQAPRFICPLTLFTTPDFTTLNWCARLVCEPGCVEQVKAGRQLEGQLRFAADAGQSNPNVIGMLNEGSAVAAKALGKMDSHGGWTVTGSVNARVSMDGHYGFALYGTAPGLRVAWVAAAVTT